VLQGMGNKRRRYHDSCMVVVMQKRGRRAFGSQAARFLNLKNGVEELPELAEVIHEPGGHMRDEGCCSVRMSTHDRR
jgi:hypothetical protein